MKFAFVGAERREAEPGLSGKCPAYGHAVIAKCGEHNVWHWAHKGTRTCDDWWEPETPWHRGWKNEFPESWQEVHHKAADGERHVADVKTELGYIEFQHSPLKPDERRSREDFYPNLVWVVDGRRRAQDRAQFFASIDGRISNSPPIFPILPNKCALLRDWLVSGVPVYFDFGDSEPGDTWRFKEPLLWLLAPCRPNGKPYLVSVRKTWFLRVHNEGRPAEGLYTKKVERVVADYLSRQAAADSRRQAQAAAEFAAATASGRCGPTAERLGAIPAQEGESGRCGPIAYGFRFRAISD